MFHQAIIRRLAVIAAVLLVALGALGLLFGGGGAAVGFGALALFVGVIVSGKAARAYSMDSGTWRRSRTRPSTESSLSP
jgi:hypothetical protein